MTPTDVPICEWFLLCDHPAAGTIAHPILPPVPTCQRCADRLAALDPETYADALRPLEDVDR